MDGFGYNPSDYGNAIRAAKKPNLERYLQGPHTLIGASGLDVGLPDGQMGNSEVGHTNIGAGRIVYQLLVKISKVYLIVTKTKLKYLMMVTTDNLLQIA